MALTQDQYKRQLEAAKRKGISLDIFNKQVAKISPGFLSAITNTTPKATVTTPISDRIIMKGATAPDIERSTKRIATSKNPLEERNTTQELQYDPNNPQDFLWRLNAKKLSGMTPTNDEYYYAQVANAAMSKAGEQQQGGGGYDEYIAQLEAERQAKVQEQMTEREKAIEAKNKELANKYDILKSVQESAGGREREAAQSATSFSGFGRSTFNADQQVEIQKQTDRALNQLEAAKQLELQAYQQELEGADAETLAPLYDAIQKARSAAQQAQLDAIDRAAKINQEQGNTREQSFNNIMSSATNAGMELDTKVMEQYAQSMQGMDDNQKAEFIAGFDPQTQLVLAGLAAGGSTMEAPEVKNIGTAKRPRYVQWNGKERVPMAGGGGYGGGGGLGGGGGGTIGGYIDATGKSVKFNKEQQDIIDAIKSIREDPATRKVVGLGSSIIGGFFTSMDPAAQGVKAKIETLRSALTLPNMGKIKGTLSDADMKILLRSATSIDSASSKPQFDLELKRIEDNIYKAAGGSAAPEPTITVSKKPNATIANTIQPYNETKTYNEGDQVTMNGKTYKLIGGKFKEI